MSANLVKVTLEVPGDVDDQAKKAARTKAHEAAVLCLWQNEKLSFREAAMDLGLSYHDFLDLLANRVIPVVQGGEINQEAIEEASCRLACNAR